jgi:hypothetical protein
MFLNKRYQLDNLNNRIKNPIRADFFVKVIFISLASLLLLASNNSLIFTLQEILIGSDTSRLDYFGWSVDIEGDTVVVGAIQDNKSNGRWYPGKAYIFRRYGSSWIEETTLVPSTPFSEHDLFGYDVAISNDVVVVSAVKDLKGSVYVFRWLDSSWIEEAKLFTSDDVRNFGQSVAVLGDTIVVGARYSNDGGYVYIYTWNGIDWQFQSRLQASDGEPDEYFGNSVAIFDDTIVIGAPNDNEGGIGAGAAYVYKRNGQFWYEETKLIASDAESYDQFGESVDVESNTIVVGSYAYGDTDTGAVYVYKWDGVAWNEEAKLLADNPMPGATLGESVVISNDTIAAGAQQDGENREGSVHIFKFNGSSWTERAVVTVSEGAYQDKFGNTVAIKEDTLVAGAYHSSTVDYLSGSVYVYILSEPNHIPTAYAGGPYSGYEGCPVVFDGSNSSDPDDDSLQYRWDFDGDGVWDAPFSIDPIAIYTWYDDYSGLVYLEVTDGEFFSTAQASVDVLNVPPTCMGITGPVDPIQVDTVANFSASFTDSGTLDTHTAMWNWGDNNSSNGTVIEENGSGTVSGSQIYTTPGVYTVALSIVDDDSGLVDCHPFQFAVVYNPEGGFITGAGWISSPEGAYTFDPTITGKATFGFVSKYKKGADSPTGETKFQFRIADLNFHSDTYDWLVVAGARAQLKGTGTINGTGNYGFMLKAVDANLTPSTDLDLFRIKIWDKDNNDAIVYDNQLGDDDDADLTTEIVGGSIVIHEVK